MKLAADEDFDGRVLRGLVRRTPLSHDVNTMTDFAVRRLRAGEPMAGLVIVPQTEAVGRVIDALIQLLDVHRDTGFEGQIV